MAGGCSSITRLSPLSSLSRPWSPELAAGSRESEEGILNWFDFIHNIMVVLRADTCWICIVFYAKIQQGWVELIMQIQINWHFSFNLKIESCLSQCWGNPARVFPHYLLVTAAPINWGKITKDEVSGDCLALWLQSEPFDEFLSSEIVWGESRYWAKEFNLYSQSLSLLETSIAFSSDKTHYGYVNLFSLFAKNKKIVLEFIFSGAYT